MQEFENTVHDGDDELRIYELGFHIVPTVGDEGVTGEVEGVRGVIAKNGGSVLFEEVPQLMRLAYSLERVIARKHHSFDTAYFGWIVFEATPRGAHAVKEAMRHNEHIVRSLMVKTERDADIVRHPATARAEKQVDASRTEERAEEKPAPAAEAQGEPMSTEQMDAEIEKLVV